MIAARRAALLALLVAALTPAALEGQQQSSDSLVHRIVVLENTVAGLEQRVRELEALIKGEPSRPQPVAASTNWRDIANWRQLRVGMTTAQVREVLGEPDRVRASDPFLDWTWGNPPQSASVRFYDDKLSGWEEPRK